MTAQDLKNSILQMAVQGKLVPQQVSEGTAAELLKKIDAEKARLVQEGKIKKDKNPSVIYRRNGSFYEKKGKVEQCIDDELPFAIPDSWEWVRLGSIVTMQAGKNIKGSDISSIQNDEYKYECFGGNGRRGFVKSYNHEGKYQLIGRQGALCGNINKACGKFYATEHAVVVSCYCGTNIEWMGYFLRAFNLNQYSTATAQPGLAVSKIEKAFISFPPLAEQQRIVDKINEVLPHIDEYAVKEQKLTQWNRRFPDDLRKSVLQEAVQGKLVPQQASDCTAAELLKKIATEKALLVQKGRIKADKNPSVIYRRDGSFYEKKGKIEQCIDDKLPFDIPDRWEWVRLGYVCDIARGGSPRPIQDFITNDLSGVNWIKIGDTDISGKYITSTKQKIKSEGVKHSRLVHSGDFLLTNSMSFGHPYILKIDRCIHDGWLVLSNYQNLYMSDFLYYILSSTFAYNQFCKKVSGAVVKNLNSEKVNNSFFPLPPLAEQQRIVDKINEVLPKCDNMVKLGA